MDWVNKQSVIQALTNYFNEVDPDNGIPLNAAKAVLIVKEAESRPKGKWNKWNDTWECSKCGFAYFPNYTFTKYKLNKKNYLGNYCMNCGAYMGADMRGEE